MLTKSEPIAPSAPRLRGTSIPGLRIAEGWCGCGARFRAHPKPGPDGDGFEIFCDNDHLVVVYEAAVS
jgi:hypothetical protein